MTHRITKVAKDMSEAAQRAHRTYPVLAQVTQNTGLAHLWKAVCEDWPPKRLFLEDGISVPFRSCLFCWTGLP